MPFHIQYTGPLPISTFFRVKEEVSLSDQSSIDTLNETSQISSQGEKIGIQERFKAAFRGRALCGLKVQIPEGYIGVVLRADAENSSGQDDVSTSRSKRVRQVASRRKSQRRKRGGRQFPEVIDVDGAIQIDEDVNLNGDIYDNDDPTNEPANKRIMQPLATFTSFVVWNPDISVDEGKDEYIRALKEWTRITAEVLIIPFLCFP